MSRRAVLSRFGLFLTLILTTTLLPACGGSPAREGSAAETIPVVERFLDATRSQRFEDVASLMHPDAVNEFHTALLNMVDQAEMKGEGEELLPLFPGCETITDVRALSPEQFFAAVYRGMIEMMPAVGEAMKEAGMHVIGSLEEEPDVAHVLYRLDLNMMGQSISQVEVITLNRYQGEWRVYLAGQLQDFMKMLGT